MKTKLDNIKMFGIELEGAWLSVPPKFKRDGSVTNFSNSGVPYTGEVVSRPFKRLDSAKEFLNTFYPEKINSTCGYHIHISTKDKKDYELLTHPFFYRDFINWAMNFSLTNVKDTSLDYRISGQNDYCNKLDKKISIQKSIKHSQIFKNNNRFYQLNYCYKKHKTLENRLFPMFYSLETAFLALGEYLTFVDDWISKNRKRLCNSNRLVRLEKSGEENV